VKKQRKEDIDHNAVIRLQNMLRVPLTLFICFVGIIATIGLSNYGPAGFLIIGFLMIGSFLSICWGVSLYIKMRRIDNNL
jgi:Na+/H+-dicarboxylate symporter